MYTEQAKLSNIQKIKAFKVAMLRLMLYAGHHIDIYVTTQTADKKGRERKTKIRGGVGCVGSGQTEPPKRKQTVLLSPLSFRALI